MSCLETALLRLQDGLHAAKDEKCFRSLAARFSKEIGYKWFAYFSNEKEFNVLSSYPKEWLESYDLNKYHKVDPIVKKASNTRVMFDWVSPETSSCKAQRKFFGEAGDYGIKAGIVIPLRAGMGRQAAMTFIGTHADALKVNDSAYADIAYKAGVFFDAYFSAKIKSQSKNSARLTLRERECLTWLSRGKLINETASIMQVTERTINNFIFLIKEKLNASSIPHAVTLAVGFGEIEVIRL